MFENITFFSRIHGIRARAFERDRHVKKAGVLYILDVNLYGKLCEELSTDVV